MNKYVTWDYEEGADPSYYHIYSTDMEPGELDIGATLFTITTPCSPEMDSRIDALATAMESVIAAATEALSKEEE